MQVNYSVNKYSKLLMVMLTNCCMMFWSNVHFIFALFHSSFLHVKLRAANSLIYPADWRVNKTGH